MGEKRGASIFQWSLLLALGSAAAVAFGSICLILFRPPPMDFPMSTMEVGRLLSHRDIARTDAVFRVVETASPLAPDEREGFGGIIRTALARQLNVTEDRVRFAFVPNSSGLFFPPIDAVRFSYERTIGPGAALYRDDPSFSPLIFGAYVASLRGANGKWVNILRTDQHPGPRWQVALSQLIGLALLLIIPIAWFFGRRLADPISAFAAAAHRVGLGGTERVPAKGPREIRTAAVAINDMQDRLTAHLKERTAVVGAIAHDLRTPLARMSFLLANKPPDLDARLEREIDGMEHMIAGALDFVRSETSEVKREVFDLGQVAESVVDDFADRGANASFQPHPRVMAPGDPALVTRIIANLVANAISYGGSAEVSVTEDSKSAIVRVRDRGPGMSPEDLARAFDPFFRSESSRNRETGGAGLGLAIVQSLARAHGGSVQLRNQSEGGLEAEVCLPRQAPG